MHRIIDLHLDLHAAHCDALDPCPRCRRARELAQARRLQRLRAQLTVAARH